MMLVCNIEVCDWYSSWSWNWLFNSFVVLSKLNFGFSKTLLIQFQQAMPVSVMPLTTSSIKASLQLDHFFTWCTIVKISKDRENKAAEKSIDAEVPNAKLWHSVRVRPAKKSGLVGTLTKSTYILGISRVLVVLVLVLLCFCEYIVFCFDRL